MSPNFFQGLIYVGSWPLNFRNISQWKIFHRHPQRHRHRSPVGFLRFGWKTENDIFGAVKLKIEFFLENMNESLCTPNNFVKEKKYFFSFCIFYDFSKNETSFCEKITLLYNRFHSQILLKDYDFWQFSIDPGDVWGYGKLRNHWQIAPGGLWNLLYDFFP